MPKQFSINLLAVAGCAILAVVVSGFWAPALARPATHVDDHWRRTSTGWEYVPDWRTAAPPTDVFAATGRIDSHPAALALLQVVAVITAFALFPHPLSGPATGWADIRPFFM